MIVGFCGKAGAGKDTAALALIKRGYKKIALADPIKRMVQDTFVIEDKVMHGRESREEELPAWKGWSVRSLLQIVGTELFRTHIDPDVWVKSLHLKIQASPRLNHVVTDVRFPNEAEYLKNIPEDFILIKVVRDGCDGNVGVEGHASEAHDLEADYTIGNNGRVGELHRSVTARVLHHKFVHQETHFRPQSHPT